MFLAYQITGFINQPYVKSRWANQRYFLHAYLERSKVKGGFKICRYTELKMLLVNQIAEFLKQLYLKKHNAHRPDI